MAGALITHQANGGRTPMALWRVGTIGDGLERPRCGHEGQRCRVAQRRCPSRALVDEAIRLLTLIVAQRPLPPPPSQPRIAKNRLFMTFNDYVM